MPRRSNTMKLVVSFLVLVAACGGDARPGKLVNPRRELGAFPPRDAQLLFHDGGGTRVADLRTLTTRELGPRGFSPLDVSDDGRVAALADDNLTQLVIVHDGAERGRIPLPRWPGTVALSPDGKHLAGTWSAPTTAEVTDELFLVDLDTLALTSVPARRRGNNIDGVYWTANSAAVVVVTDRESLDVGPRARGTSLPAVAYDLASRTHVTLQLTPSDFVATTWSAGRLADGGPATCTTASGEVISGDWRRLADVRGMITHPHVSAPVRSWGFLDDCSLYLVHDSILWLVDAQRRAVSLGRVSHLVRPTAFPGSPFTAK